MEAQEAVAACDVAELADALATVSRIAPLHPGGVESASLVVQFGADQLKIVATTSDVTEELTLAAATRTPAEFMVPARALGDFVQLLPRGTMSLRLVGDGLRIQSGLFNTVIRADRSAIQRIEQSAEEPVATVESGLFLDALDRVKVARSTDDSRPVMHGVLMTKNEKTILLAAADAYRVAEERIRVLEGVRAQSSAILPARCVEELRHVLRNGSDHVRIALSERANRITFASGTQLFRALLMEGRFPAYQNVLPTTPSIRVAANRADLLIAIRGCAIFAMHGADPVSLSADGTSLVVSGSSTQLGDNQASLAVESVGKSSVTLLGSYLLGVLSALSTESVILELRSPITPVVVRPIGGPDYWCAIAPRLSAEGMQPRSGAM